MSNATLLSLLLLAVAFGACGGQEATPVDDLCATGDAPSATLGKGVGSVFVPYEDGEAVGLVVASQGGFGVSVLVRTQGLLAGEGLTADVQLNVEDHGEIVGEFLQENTGFSCRGKNVGGELRGVVVGFDRSKYKTNDDLLTLDGLAVDMVVTVTDRDGNQATARQPVVIRVGG